MRDMLAAGTTLGPRAIIAKRGEGGMGVDYRARDARLDRDVGIKTLPASILNDRVRSGLPA